MKRRLIPTLANSVRPPVFTIIAVTFCCFWFGQNCQPISAQSKDSALPDSWSEKIEWRCVGPANMMGRITSIAVYPQDTTIWWASSASGGLLKTTNNGVSFEHQFDQEATVSIGDVQVADTNPDLLWVGTGEANPRNSVSWGDGVYKSIDGGKTWKNMGLKKTFQIGRIAIHPEDHDVVYVGALGRLWGPNEERGLFKTTDGGETWNKIFYVDEKTGVIDVQMNPKNPDELIIATYERMRDGFDGNDPIKKYGPGSAIYKTVDAGETFVRLTNGLPTCNLGRIGLCYFEKDPKVIAAIVESEKIAQEPDNAAYAGLRGEDAEVGARLTRIVDDGPAKKAGLKENDIVVSVDGELVYSYRDLLKEFRKHQAGETAKVLVSRDRKPEEVVIEFANRPKPKKTNGQERQRNRRNAFTGTLGGQAANLQGQQGSDEQEYGGVYLSEDGGESWKRINTLNPRPMYYSQIRIDPVDRNNMYVLGTSLYRSTDGGETFTGDGGRGIHPDNHALWIDPADSRHMVLGNDGGIYVTHDRMDSWDHLNHVAIGQFYHVGIGPSINYRVYGGLQDNGSWGGPARVSNDSGVTNSDWFRVGGGDGFITLVDPDDPDQIYFESQNGGMGRVHLKTGERGFIRPRPPKGVKYRFNWKTPFMLSPHNSKIHYSAGNYVFRSYDKGRGIKSISPDITNSDQGAASAITESPLEAGVIYVGTTDGAVWMTKDGGHNWGASFSQKQAPDGEKEKDNDSAADSSDPSKTANSADSEANSASEPADSAETVIDKVAADKTKKSADAPDSTPELSTTKVTNIVDGVWRGEMVFERFPPGQAPKVGFVLQSDDQGNVTGTIETRRGEQEITAGNFDSKTKQLTLVIETDRGKREFKATVNDGVMSGTMIARGGRLEIQFTANKEKDPLHGTAQIRETLAAVTHPEISFVSTAMVSLFPKDDPVTGKWQGVVTGEQLPEGEIEFTIELKMDAENGIAGTIESPRGEFEIQEGQYNSESKKIYFNVDSDQFYLDYEAILDGTSMLGNVLVNDEIELEFEATRVGSQAEAASAADSETEPMTDNDPEMQDDAVERSPQTAAAEAELPAAFLGVFVDQELKILNFVEDSPATRSDLKIGDRILTVNDVGLEDIESLLAELEKYSAGDQIRVEVDRAGSSSLVEIVLAQRPARIPEGSSDSSPRDTYQAETSKPEDEISGVWNGSIETPQGTSDLELILSMKNKDQISGSYKTSRSEGEITSGRFNPERSSLNLVAENDRFTLEFNGKIESGNLEGQIELNSGDFSMDFSAKRSSPTDKQDDLKTTDAKTIKGRPLQEWLTGPRWVSSLEASKFNASRCYITLDGHRSDDDSPYLFVTEDYGKTWKSIQGNLPATAGSTRVLREDRKNENVLYLGCEFGAWVSIDRGVTWTKFKSLPTVAVHEIAQHPVLDDIVAGTHGRSLWVADVSLLRQLSKTVADSNSNQLFAPRDVILWQRRARRGSSGTRRYVANNPAVELKIQFTLGDKSRVTELVIRDVAGKPVKRFSTTGQKGLNVVTWDLRQDSGRGRFGPLVQAGEYLVELRIDDLLLQQKFSVKKDPELPPNSATAETEDQWWQNFAGGEINQN